MSKGKKSTATQDQREPWISEYIDGLLAMRVPREETEDDEDAKENNSVSDRDDNQVDSDDDNNADEDDEDVETSGTSTLKCPTPGCKRKCKAECLHKMCFLCCYEKESETWCPAHITERMKKLEEDRYIDEGLAGSKRKKQFDHFEDRFHNPRQTVVIFCLRDFLRYKIHSGDIFLQYEREDRQRQLRKRRLYAASGIDVNTNVNMNSNTNNNSNQHSFAGIEAKRKACKEKAQARYERVKAAWSKKLGLGLGASVKDVKNSPARGKR